MRPVPETVLSELAKRYATDRSALVHIGGGRGDSDGIVYQYAAGHASNVLKIMAIPDNDPDGLTKTKERLKFARFLGDRGVDIVYPVPSAGGLLLETLHEGDHTYVAYAMLKCDGVHPAPNHWSPDLYRSWGRTIGRAHRITMDYPSWQCSVVNDDGRTVLGWCEEWQAFFQWCRDDEVKERWVSIRHRLEELPLGRDIFGFIHNDPHSQNILVNGNRVILLDFDVANYHWFATDIAIALQSILFSVSGGIERPVAKPEPIRVFLRSFMDGYRTEHHLGDEWLDRLDLFISYRRVLLFTVMQDWLQGKPDLRRAWKDMIVTEPGVVGDLSF